MLKTVDAFAEIGTVDDFVSLENATAWLIKMKTDNYYRTCKWSVSPIQSGTDYRFYNESYTELSKIPDSTTRGIVGGVVTVDNVTLLSGGYFDLGVFIRVLGSRDLRVYNGPRQRRFSQGNSFGFSYECTEQELATNVDNPPLPKPNLAAASKLLQVNAGGSAYEIGGVPVTKTQLDLKIDEINKDISSIGQRITNSNATLSFGLELLSDSLREFESSYQYVTSSVPNMLPKNTLPDGEYIADQNGNKIGNGWSIKGSEIPDSVTSIFLRVKNSSASNINRYGFEIVYENGGRLFFSPTMSGKNICYGPLFQHQCRNAPQDGGYILIRPSFGGFLIGDERSFVSAYYASDSDLNRSDYAWSSSYSGTVDGPGSFRWANICNGSFQHAGAGSASVTCSPSISPELHNQIISGRFREFHVYVHFLSAIPLATQVQTCRLSGTGPGETLNATRTVVLRGTMANLSGGNSICTLNVPGSGNATLSFNNIGAGGLNTNFIWSLRGMYW